MSTRNHKISVASVIKFQDEILMIHENQEGQIYIDMPAGGVEHGETLEEAVVREIKEETNLDVDTPTLIGIFEYIEPEKTTINFLYVIELSEKKELTKIQDEDVVDIQWMKTEEVQNLLKTDTAKFEHKLAIARLKYAFGNKFNIQNINYIQN
jgi:ADP-ribose pyrophosphatase YjhB (NUDIX family)